MITQDDIDAFADEPIARPTKIRADVAQYYMRQAFEEGFRAAYHGHIRPTKDMWFHHWLASQTRGVLVANGLITGKEGYK